MNWLYGAVLVLVGLAALKWLVGEWCVRHWKDIRGSALGTVALLMSCGLPIGVAYVCGNLYAAVLDSRQAKQDIATLWEDVTLLDENNAIRHNKTEARLLKLEQARDTIATSNTHVIISTRSIVTNDAILWRHGK